jgi:hypothetical protein
MFRDGCSHSTVDSSAAFRECGCVLQAADVTPDIDDPPTTTPAFPTQARSVVSASRLCCGTLGAAPNWRRLRNKPKGIVEAIKEGMRIIGAIAGNRPAFAFRADAESILDRSAV